MGFFVIDESRLLHHLEYDVRKHARGVMNWWVEKIRKNKKGGFRLVIVLDIQSVSYVYRLVFGVFDDIRVEISSMLKSETMVNGYLSAEVLSKGSVGLVTGLLPERKDPNSFLSPTALPLLPGDYLGRGLR